MNRLDRIDRDLDKLKGRVTRKRRKAHDPHLVRPEVGDVIYSSMGIINLSTYEVDFRLTEYKVKKVKRTCFLAHCTETGSVRNVKMALKTDYQKTGLVGTSTRFTLSFYRSPEEAVTSNIPRQEARAEQFRQLADHADKSLQIMTDAVDDYLTERGK